MTIYQEKYGFVYIWYDRKHKRYYIGSHWGFEDDGYICSSNWMRHAYRRRPQDFKRRILTRYYGNRRGLYDIEQRWLDLIKPEELATGKRDTNKSTTIRYYNFNKQVFIPWHSTDEGIKIVGAKISKANKGKVFGPRDPSVGKNISATKTRKFTERQEKYGYKFTPEHCANMAKSRQGYKHTEEWKAGQSIRSKEMWANGTRKRAEPPQKMTIEEQAQLSSERLKKNWADPEWKERQQIRLSEGAQNRPPRSDESKEKARIAQKGKPKEANAKIYIITFTNGEQQTIKGLVKYAKDSDIPLSSLSGAANKSVSMPKYNILSVKRI